MEIMLSADDGYDDGGRSLSTPWERVAIRGGSTKGGPSQLRVHAMKTDRAGERGCGADFEVAN